MPIKLKDIINMKNFFFIAFFFLTVGCTSSVENYIKNEFPQNLREDSLENEQKIEEERITIALKDMANDANPDAAESEKLMAQYRKLRKSLDSRHRAFDRTNNLYYVINIFNDEENCNNLYAKAQRLKKKSRPYINHVDKQIESFVKCLKEVDCKALIRSDKSIKNDTVGIEYIFNHIIGVPDSLANPSKEDMKKIANAVWNKYFIENPTPKVKACEYNDDDDNWFILLSNNEHYLLKVIECDDGEYKYEYKQIEDSFDKGSDK